MNTSGKPEIIEVSAIDGQYSDAHFKVHLLPQWRADFYRFLSLGLWGWLPGRIQRGISRFYTTIYRKPFSRHIINPYLRFNYSKGDYLQNFVPPSGKSEFENFQDFFTRKFKTVPQNSSPWVWPCEGLLCDQGTVGSFGSVRVKNDRRDVNTIFGLAQGEIPSGYCFTNVFLHNKNYHRIHAPTEGVITHIVHIPGDLVILRPWIYKQDPSLPAFRNERYILHLKDSAERTWYMSIVGGPAVGTIHIQEHVKIGTHVRKLEELAVFHLGSTCCMAAPRAPRFHSKNAFVEVGATY